MPSIVVLGARKTLTLKPGASAHATHIAASRANAIEFAKLLAGPIPAARCYQKTAAAMSAAMWGGNEPNDD